MKWSGIDEITSWQSIIEKPFFFSFLTSGISSLTLVMGWMCCINPEGTGQNRQSTARPPECSKPLPFKDLGYAPPNNLEESLWQTSFQSNQIVEEEKKNSAKQDSFPASHFPPPTENASPLKLLAKIKISGGVAVILKFYGSYGQFEYSSGTLYIAKLNSFNYKLPLLFSLLMKCTSVCVHWMCEERKGACKRGANFWVEFPRILGCQGTLRRP